MTVSSARRMITRAVRPALDSLERRQFLDAVPFNLTTGSLIQDWNNTSLISAADNWSGVPSIEGYFQTTSAAANRDPQTILTDANSAIDVVPNLTSGNASNGGVLEVQLATPISSSGNNTVGMQGSNNADDPYLKLYLNNAGRAEPVRIRYDLIDIDSTAGGTANSRQSFALQYRTSNTGNYTNVPAGYVLNAASFTLGETGQTTAIDVTLPADTAGANLVEVRILTTNTDGDDQLVAVDNIRVFGNDIFAFQPASYTVAESAGTLNLVVKRLGDLNGSVSVNYTLNPGTATSPADFTGTLSGTLTFGNGVDTQNIPITLTNDASPESTENFTATLSTPTGGFQLGADATATVTINDDDAPIPSVVVNELKVNPPNVDTSAEYVEVRGTPGGSLANVYFVSIEGDGTGTGLADVVVDLSSATIGSNGYLVIGDTTLSVAAGSTLFTDPRFANSGGILENGSNSFALVYSLTPLLDGMDFDAEGDGVLDLPAGATLIDAVGFVDGTAPEDRAYGVELVQPGLFFHAVSRFPGNSTPLSAAAWYGGNLLEVSLTSSSETGVYDPRAANSSANLPLGAVLTPGAENYPTGANAGSFVLIPVTQALDENLGSVTVQVYRAGGATGAATVDIGAGAGTATLGDDFSSFAQTLSFADGEYLKTITINLVDDTVSEVAETIGVQLSNPTGATILREGLGQVTINLSDEVAPTGLLLNELNVNPPGTDQPFEYVELRGAPNSQLVSVYLLSIEGSGAGAGTLDRIVPITGATIGSNGLLMIKAITGGFTPESAATGVFGISLFDEGNSGLEGDSNTVMIVFIPTSATLPSNGADLDEGNTGTLLLPAGAIVLDSVSYMDSDVGDIAYSPAVLTAVSSSAGDAPDALVRFPDDTDANETAAWYWGNLITTGSVQTQLDFFATAVSSNFPAGGKLTPGGVNAPSGDTVAPTVVSGAFNFLTPSGISQSVTVTFSEDVEASLVEADFSLVNLDTNAVVPLTLLDISGGGTVATLGFTGTGNALGGSILADGHYRLRVLAGQVADAAGNTLAADADTLFAFKNADFDGDLDVDFDNLLTLAQNYGGVGKTFAQGDVNYDGAVNFDDLLALAQRYGTSLFSSTPIVKTRAAGRRGNAAEIV